jgi:hypothetical protein
MHSAARSLALRATFCSLTSNVTAVTSAD